jgi:hypothetical protein
MTAAGHRPDDTVDMSVVTTGFASSGKLTREPTVDQIGPPPDSTPRKLSIVPKSPGSSAT